jgi:peroxiredoxin
MSWRSFARIALFGLVAGPAPAQSPTVGAPAPAIAVTAWLNWDGAAPTVESLKGRVVLLEFWGTWCGPCVRAMPGVQKLHDRYRERGLTVLAISYESPEKLQPFLKENAFTMPVGSDPEKKTIAAYGIRGWPTTIVLDKEGKVAHVGSPYEAEAVVEKALGLEAGPAALLTRYFDSLLTPARPAQREALQRLVEKATPDFDLQAWARSHLPPETVAEGAPPRAPGEPASSATGRPAVPADLLRRCALAWGKPAQRAPLLQQLGDAEAAPFDLAAFAREAFGKAFPLDAAELKTLLQDKRYGEVVDAIADRAPPAAVLATARKHADLADYCRSKAGEARTMARKGLMAQLWMFANALPRDEKLNRAFQSELAISGIATSPDRKSITGILLGGEMLQREHAASFVKSQLSRAILMEDLGAGRLPRAKELARLFEQERAAIVKDLESRYGKPEPHVAK